MKKQKKQENIVWNVLVQDFHIVFHECIQNKNLTPLTSRIESKQERRYAKSVAVQLVNTEKRMHGILASSADNGIFQTFIAGRSKIQFIIKYFILNFFLFFIRCHSWWIQDEIPYEKDKFRQRIYWNNQDRIQHQQDACETCEARIFPYQMREPCNSDKHTSSCKLQTCQSVRKGEMGKRFFCQDCQNTRNFQCGFCFKKFFSSESAQHHIETYHSIKALTDFKCEICDLKEEFLSIPIAQRIRINNRALPKWISTNLRLRRIEKQIQLQSIEEKEEKKEVDFSDEKTYEEEFPKLIEQTDAEINVNPRSYANISRQIIQKER